MLAEAPPPGITPSPPPFLPPLHNARLWRLAFNQNAERKARRLTLPVLAIGVAESVGEGIGAAVKLVADVQTLVVLAGHWIAEQAPEETLAALTDFLAPYRTEASASPKRVMASR